MSFISSKQLVDAFVQLGKHLRKHSLPMAILQAAQAQNIWFTPTNCRQAIQAIAQSLEESKVSIWLKPYQQTLIKQRVPIKIGVIMAGNIPAVGWHDFLCVLISGHHLVAKLSSKDAVLLPAIAQQLIKIESRLAARIHFVSTLNANVIDAVIATGSNNAARYFAYHYGHLPHIIRQNRHSVAVIAPNECNENLLNLGKDLFWYFGLGCRNVSKLYLPTAFDWQNFFDVLQVYKTLIQNSAYANNYKYQKALAWSKNEVYKDNGFAIWCENSHLSSPIAKVNYTYYKRSTDVLTDIQQQAQNIQCILGQKHLEFGQAQQVQLWQYADGIDTLRFLLNF